MMMAAAPMLRAHAKARARALAGARARARDFAKLVIHQRILTSPIVRRFVIVGEIATERKRLEHYFSSCLYC